MTQQMTRADIPEEAWGLPGLRFAPPLAGAEAFCVQPILALLQAVAARDPAAVALVSATGRMDYGTLALLVARLAAAIAARVPPGGAVATLLPQQPEAIAGILAVLAAGRVCLVLNPGEPAERLALLLEDAAPAAVLVPGPWDGAPGIPQLNLADLATAEAPPLAGQWDPDAPAAVHFTSGSSGRPKGVVLSARSILYRALDACATFGLGPADALLVTALPSTSAGLAFLLGALGAGARMLVVNIGAEGAGSVLRLAARERVSAAAAGPALWRVLLRLPAAAAAFAALRVMRVGNSALPWADLRAWRRVLPAGCAVLHTYASTEALVMAQWICPAEPAAGEVSLAAGLAQPGHEYALLGEDGGPVPPGEAGELALRGPLLALGEWQGGRLVEGRFPPVPGRPGWRSFRTGDVLRVEADGLLRMLGRADRQVKVNGVRVEPGEIEAVLRAEPGVVDAVVLAREVAGRVLLQAFVAAPGQEAVALVAGLRRRLAAALPAVLRPAGITVLERLPLLAGGKVDMTTLRAMPLP